MPTTDTMIAVRISAGLLDEIDTEARRLGLSRSALVRARLQHPDPLDGAVVRDAADQLRGLLDQIDSGHLTATPLAAPHLRGATVALTAAAHHQEIP